MRGFSLVELLIVVAIIVLLIAVAMPHFASVRLNAAETVVARELQTIDQAQTQYLSQFGVYAATLEQLGPPANGPDGPGGANLIPVSLVSGDKDGYLFEMKLTATGFAVSARPHTFGSSGRRTFYLDQSGVIHQNWSAEPATASSPVLR